ncbi:MAG: polysaccharide pyruvyl transferase family protein [Pontiellaceae bacterium]
MKIGIITFHDGLNHGAYLQAFSTMMFLREKSHDVFIINYKNRLHDKKEGYTQIFKYRNPFRIIDFLKKKKAFKISQKKLYLTPFTTNPMDILSLKFDLIIVGSDVVWNTDIFGFDNIYFGGLINCKQISYAASFGWGEPNEEIIGMIKKGINNFSDISVRDKRSQSIIENLTNKIPDIVVDPVFLTQWNLYEKISERIQDLPPFILIYAYKLDEMEIEHIIEYAKNNNLISISIGYRQKWCDSNYLDVDPFEWLGFFKKASRVITSTFHGTIFSIIYNKRFYVSINEKNKSRIETLLELTDLNNIVESNVKDALTYDARNSLKMMNKNIIKSKKWLINSIK